MTAGVGLGLWLLLARVWGVTLLGASWLALVQVHGLVQLFGFTGLFAAGIGFALDRAGESYGWSIIAGGLLALAAGCVLVWVRSRLPEP